MPDISLSAVANFGKSLDAATGISDATVAEVNNTLGNMGMLPEDIKIAADAIKNLPAGVTGSVMAMAKSGTMTLTSAAPVIAMALTASGVGAPAAAVVAAALPVVDSLGHALGLFGTSGAPHFDWTVGYQGFVGHIPYGPNDPEWKDASKIFPPLSPDQLDYPISGNWKDYTGKSKQDLTGVIKYISGGPVYTGSDGVPIGASKPEDFYFPAWSGKPDFRALDAAFEEYRNIECDLYDLANVGPISFRTKNPGIEGVSGDFFVSNAPNRFRDWPYEAEGFAKAFYGAWKINSIKAFNGHKYATAPAILQAVHNGWNRAHSNTKTFTLSPKQSAIITREQAGGLGNKWRGTFVAGPWPRYVPSNISKTVPGFLNGKDSNTFIDAIINGDFDNNRWPPLVINTGAPATVPIPKFPPSHIQGMLLGSKKPIASKAPISLINHVKKKSGASPYVFMALGLAALYALKRRYA
jgi:hypothetical protein